MAEAVALVGVVATSIQCADVGIRLLMSGSKLCSKIKDAPDKVKDGSIRYSKLLP
jgi:hypothetical protein